MHKFMFISPARMHRSLFISHGAHRLVFFLAAAALATISASGAGCRPSQSLEGQAKDARTAAQIKSKLVAEVGAATLTSVDVNVTNGVATLSGPVHSAQESQRIESVTRSIPGVTEVRNSLQVISESSAPSAPSTSSPAMTPLPTAATTPAAPGKL
jgi:hypothetical protein